MSLVQKKIALIVLLILIVIGALLMIRNIYTKEAEWSINRTIRYSFTLENKTSKPIFNTIFKTFSPLAISSSQKLVNLKSNSIYSSELDKFGNTILDFTIEVIPPYGKKSISITADLKLSKIVAGTQFEDELYLSEQPMIESNNEVIISLAQSILSESEIIQKDLYDWLLSNVEYSGYGLKDKGALYAANNLEGDCTEFAYLNVALNRALGFPSRAVNGYVVNHNSKIHPSDFHTWSEVWMDQGWHVIDAQKKNYLENQQNYIAMNIVTDTLNNKQQFKKFWVSNLDLIVTMK